MAVQTAARVLLNTVIGAVDQVLNARSPEKLALIELIDERIAASASNIDQQISITGALERAQTRVIEGLYTDVTPIEDNTSATANLLSSRGNGLNESAVVADYQE